MAECRKISFIALVERYEQKIVSWTWCNLIYFVKRIDLLSIHSRAAGVNVFVF